MNINHVITPAAFVLFVLLALRAVLTIDPYFDSFAYHLPFASRLAGVCPKTCYEMHPFLEVIHDGYPKLFNWLVGLIWSATGSLRAAHLLNLLAVFLFCVYLRQWFHVPIAWSFLGLLAVPLIQIHVTSSYIDVPLNVAASTAILCLMVLARSPETFAFRSLALIAGCLVLIANSKYQMLLVAGALTLAFFLLVALPLARGRRVGPWLPGGFGGWLQVCLFFGVLGALVGASAIKNFIVFDNPFYPLDTHVFGLAFKGPYAGVVGTTPWEWLSPVWANVPSPLRWLASVLEVQAYNFRPLPWNFDQGAVNADAISFRMGGYFVPYVLFLGGFLAWRLAAVRGRDRLLLAATFLLTTLLVLVLPAPHILRYYHFWIIVLISLCLIAMFDRRFGAPPPLAQRHVLGCGILIALASVVSITGAQYVTPWGVDTQGLIRQLGIDRRIAAVADNAIVCVDPAWQPFTFLFAPIFHPDRRYSVLDGPIGECTVVITRE